MSGGHRPIRLRLGQAKSTSKVVRATSDVIKTKGKAVRAKSRAVVRESISARLSSVSWDDLEDLIVDTTISSINALLDANPGHTLYVVGLHSVDRELDGILTLPLLGANSVQAYAADHAGFDDSLGYWGIRWNPQKWHWPQLIRDDRRLLLSEMQLHKLAACGSQNQWMKTEVRLWRALATACKRIGIAYKGSARVTEDFVVLLVDKAGGPHLARRGMSERLFLEHFPEQGARKREHRRIAALPMDEQVDFFIGRLGEHGKDIGTQEAAERLRDIGEPAVAALMQKLTDKQIGWYAAMLLGQIGIRSSNVVAALRQQVKDARILSHRGWCASALAFLDDAHYLLDHHATLPDSIIVAGVTAPLSLFRDRCLNPVPLTYAPLTRLIETSEELDAMAEQELHPENAVCVITDDEVGTAVAALSSPYRAIRWHAATVLGGRTLDRSASDQVVPELTARLADDDVLVRQLAAGSLKAWDN